MNDDVTRKPSLDAAESQTPRMCGNSMRENREIPQPPTGNGPEGRAGKAKSRNPAMYGCGKSDNPIVPEKLSNNGCDASQPAEKTEGKRLARGNSSQPTKCLT